MNRVARAVAKDAAHIVTTSMSFKEERL